MSDGKPRTSGAANMARQLIDLGHGVAERVDRRLGPVALLVLRLPVAIVFWRSGRAKVEGWNIFSVRDSQYFLFREEFGMPMPELTAHVTAIAEHILPALLVLGLFTRLSALGMFIMTMVIQFFVFPDAWLGQHMFWASLLFAVIVLGPGQISLDRVFFKR